MRAFYKLANLLIPIVIESFEGNYELKLDLIKIQEEINKFLSEE